jgi:hypothetical protein
MRKNHRRAAQEQAEEQMTTPTTHMSRARAVARARDGAVTLGALLLAFAAFDDITTGDETDFTVEYGALLACAGWLLCVTFRLMRASRRVLGATSFGILAGALWTQRAIEPGLTPGLWPTVTIASGFVWFIVVGAVLLASGWRAHPERYARQK